MSRLISTINFDDVTRTSVLISYIRQLCRNKYTHFRETQKVGTDIGFEKVRPIYIGCHSLAVA